MYAQLGSAIFYGRLTKKNQRKNKTKTKSNKTGLEAIIVFALCSHPVTISDQELYKKTKRFSVVDQIKSRRRFDSVCLEGILQVALRSDAIWNPRRARKSLFHLIVTQWQQRVTVSKGSQGSVWDSPAAVNTRFQTPQMASPSLTRTVTAN